MDLTFPDLQLDGCPALPSVLEGLGDTELIRLLAVEIGDNIGDSERTVLDHNFIERCERTLLNSWRLSKLIGTISEAETTEGEEELPPALEFSDEDDRARRKGGGDSATKRRKTKQLTISENLSRCVSITNQQALSVELPGFLARSDEDVLCDFDLCVVRAFSIALGSVPVARREAAAAFVRRACAARPPQAQHQGSAKRRIHFSTDEQTQTSADVKVSKCQDAAAARSLLVLCLLPHTLVQDERLLELRERFASDPDLQRMCFMKDLDRFPVYSEHLQHLQFESTVLPGDATGVDCGGSAVAANAKTPNAYVVCEHESTTKLDFSGDFNSVVKLLVPLLPEVRFLQERVGVADLAGQNYCTGYVEQLLDFLLEQGMEYVAVRVTHLLFKVERSSET
ncbi:unnamed protein product [Amoebophrya sp. A25]|nr:unnamed protein product [Amoebophrya sp. A25]|eukprot:GSA25T00017482001.1